MNLESMTDEDLAILAKDTDIKNSAISIIYSRNKEYILNSSIKILRDKYLAEENLSMVSEKLLNGSLYKYNGSKFKTWLYKIIKNSAIDIIRKNKVLGTSLHDEISDKNELTIKKGIYENAEREFNPHLIITIKERDKILYEEFSKLKPEMQEILILHYVEGLGWEKISKIKNVNCITLRTKALYAKEILRKNPHIGSYKYERY